MHEVLTSRPLYKQLEEEEIISQRSELERKKEELRVLRSFEPVDYQNLQKHTKKYLIEKRVKEHELS